MKSFETHSEEETIEVGRIIARGLPKGSVVLLIGNLGAGKTTLAKGIVSGLGAAEPDDVTTAASAPSSAAIFSSAIARVGFPWRV